MKAFPGPRPRHPKSTMRVMPRGRWREGLRFKALVVGIIALFSTGSLRAAPPQPASKPDEAPRARIPDVVLVDQHGKKHRFYTDLIKGRLVLMNAMYTRCRGTCPMQATIFAQATRLLRQRQDLPVKILSVSLEPEVDTPEKLASFASRYDAGEDWLFLTGKPDDVKAVLDAMDIGAPRPEEHAPLCVVGNDASGTWMKMVNLSAPADIVSRLEFVRGRAVGARPGK